MKKENKPSVKRASKKDVKPKYGEYIITSNLVNIDGVLYKKGAIVKLNKDQLEIYKGSYK